MFSESQLSILVAFNFWKKLVHCRRKKKSNHVWKTDILNCLFFFPGAGNPNGLCVVSQGREKNLLGMYMEMLEMSPHY